MIFIARCSAGSARCREWNTCPQASAFPGATSRALNISFTFAVEGATRENGQDDLRARFRSISPGFFDTLGVPLLQGRDFRDTDRDGSERVVIISQSVAQDAVSRAGRAEPQFALDRPRDEVYRHQPRAAADHRRGA